MELIGSWRFGENACLPRLPWPVVMLIARLSVAGLVRGGGGGFAAALRHRVMYGVICMPMITHS